MLGELNEDLALDRLVFIEQAAQPHGRPLITAHDRRHLCFAVGRATVDEHAQSRDEILALSGLSDAGLGELESIGLVAGHGGQGLFDEHDLAIAEVARGFTEAGIDIRHLKAWKIAADREAGLLEQRVLPVLRRRTPDARAEANELLDELSDLGGRLRAMLVARGVGTLREPRSESR